MRGGDRGDVHAVTQRVGQAGGGSLLDHLLMPALERAVALEQVNDIARAVGEHLHLDVARAHHRLFQQHGVVAERGLRLPLGSEHAFRELARAVDEAHALAAATRHRLDQQRKADAGRRALEPHQRLVLVLVARCDGYAGGLHHRLGRVLQAHRADGGGRRADPGRAGGDHRFGERGVLRQEAVAGVHRVRAGRAHGGDDAIDVEIAFARGRGAEPDRAVGVLDMQRVRVRV